MWAESQFDMFSSLYNADLSKYFKMRSVSYVSIS